MLHTVEGQRHLYRPAASRQSCVREEGRSFLTRVFQGDMSSLLTHFAREAGLGRDKIDELRNLLDDDTTKGKDHESMHWPPRTPAGAADAALSFVACGGARPAGPDQLAIPCRAQARCPPGWKELCSWPIGLRAARRLPVAPLAPTSIHNLYRGAARAVTRGGSQRLRPRTTLRGDRLARPGGYRLSEPATFLNVPTERATPVTGCPRARLEHEDGVAGMRLFVWLAESLMVIGTRYV